jgi:hypothetical protein
MENNMLQEESKSFDPMQKHVDNYLKNNKTMYDNEGKYYDEQLFNNKFDDYIKKENKQRLLEGKIKTNDLNEISNITIQPYELPLNKIMINIKNMWFGIFDDVMDQNNPLDDINNDQIFYMAISLVAISLIYLFLYVIFN